ncbi:MAG: cache domain-containing protein [Desulforhopalus sp.]|nr:cache domain-containing protein [Desulforhopalus sp.]
MIQVEKDKIRTLFYFGSVSSILLIAITLGLVFTESLNKEYQIKVEQLSTGIINEKKRFLSDAVNRTIFLIDSERKLAQSAHESSTLSQQQIDEIAIQRISTHIRNLRLIDDGYIWVNRIVDYQGGDKYAIRQIHPNMPETEGSWLSTKTTDIKGNHPYETELNGIKSKGELYFDYYFKKLGSDTIAHKMTFAKLYEPFNWVVATGVYLDDIDQLVAAESSKMRTTFKRQIIITSIVVGIALLLSVAILVTFEKLIRKMIQSHEQKIETYTRSLIEENRKTEEALANVRQLKGMLPICANCKKIRDDKGYWNQVEVYIQEHSDASFSHGICPECVKVLYGKEEWYLDAEKDQEHR